MKKVIYFILLVAASLFGITQEAKATVYANAVVTSGPCNPIIPLVCASGVINPLYAVDNDPATFTLMKTDLGIGSSSFYEVRFPVSAPGGTVIKAVLQAENSILSLSLLNTLTATLYDSLGNVISTVSGFNLGNVELINGGGLGQQYVLNMYSPIGLSRVKSVRLHLGGFLQLLNSLRIYSVFYNAACPPFYATQSIGQSNNQLLCLTGCVNDAGNIVDGNPNNYGTFSTVVSVSNMYVEVGFTTPADTHDFVGFTLANVPALVSLNILGNLTAEFLDNSGNVLFSVSNLSNADIFLADAGNSLYGVGMRVPSHITTPVYRARLRYTGVSVLYTMRIYNAFHYRVNPPTARIAASSNVLCHGSSVTLSAANINSTAWQWSPGGQTTNTITVTQPGTYNLTITEDGCSASDAITIIQRATDLSSTSQITEPACFGQSNGSAQIQVVGGNPGYTYSWSHNPNVTTAMASSIPAGNYTVVATDLDGCRDTVQVVVTQPDTLIAQVATTISPSCFGLTNGSAQVHITGGTAGYMFTWSHNNLLNDSIATALGAGSYTAFVTDTRGCTGSTQVQITEPAALISTPVASANPLCFGLATGNAQVQTVGGTGGYTYSWSHNVALNNTTATGLTAGIYNAYVTDANGCADTTQFIITEPTQVTMSPAASTNPLCFGLSTGDAQVQTVGGTGGYTYSWSHNSGLNNVTATGLTAGTYNAYVTDANGCADTTQFIITEPSALISTPVASSNPLCFGLPTGDAQVQTIGGTGGYTYSWSHNLGLNNAMAIGLTAGTYNAYVTDGNGCTDTVQFSITEPTQVDMSAVASTNPLCFGLSTGDAQVQTTGGTGGYTYSWSHNLALNNATASSLTAGTYSAYVTDGNGCTDTVQFTITEPTQVTMSPIASTNPLCFGLSTGDAQVQTVGGTGGYTYSWSHNSGLNNAIASGLTAGTYSAYVTDGNGCADTVQFSITEPTQLIMNAVASTNPLCFGLPTGDAQVQTTGGAGGYTYSWSHNSGLNNATASGLTAGTYNAYVTDGNGCTDTVQFSITEPTQVDMGAVASTNPLCFGLSTGDAQVQTTGGTGGYTYSWSHNLALNNTTASGLAAGTYNAYVTDGNGCADTIQFIITEPDQVISNLSGQNGLCFGDNSGSITLVPAGGTGGLNITVNGNLVASNVASGTIFPINSISPNTYIVNISDVNGCSVQDTIQITEPAQLVNQFANVVDADCNLSNGSGTVTTTGGTSGYTYDWSHDGNATGNSVTNLPLGNTQVIITDANGCSDTVSVSIQSINAPDAVLVADSVICKDGASGTASVISITGNGGYTYQWLDANQNPIGQTGMIANNLAAGTYIVQITDVNGCVVWDTATIHEPLTKLGVTIQDTSEPLCFGDLTASALASGSNGFGALSYNWTPGNISGFSLTNVAAGVYVVTCTDAKGCTATDTVLLTQPAQLTLDETIQHVRCFGENNGSISLTAGGGVGGYTYSWAQNPSVNPVISNLNPGTYSATVEDTNGCVFTKMFNVIEPDVLEASAGNIQTPDCGTNSGVINIDVAGGTTEYSFIWSDGSTDQTLMNVSNGNYSVYIFDANQCMDSLFFTLDCEATFMIPELVSPNGNGQNDTWMIPGLDKFPNAGVEIFNRWGNLVFDQAPYENNWGGNSTGMTTMGNGLLPSGTYFYLLNLGDGSKVISGYIELQH